MDQVIKEKWIAALESGEYKQCNGQLSYKDGFCCLGVLTDLYLKETNQEWNQNGILRDHGGLNKKVQVWSGIDSFLPTVKTEFGRKGLHNINDVEGRSFQDIADIFKQVDPE